MSTAEQQRRWRAKKAAGEGRKPGKPGRPVSAPCGTLAAYKRHLRRGEPPCDACKAANAERSRNRRKP